MESDACVFSVHGINLAAPRRLLRHRSRINPYQTTDRCETMSSDYLKALNIGSGLDTTQIVEAIVNARKVPREKIINGNITARETQTSSLSEVKNALSTFQTNMSLYDGVNGIAMNRNSTAITAAITNADKARAFSHDIEISNLATAQVLAFSGFASADQTIGTGTLSFDFGTWMNGSFTSAGTNASVTVTSGNGTLEGIAASINDADIGVTASVVKGNDSSYHLMLKSSEGMANAMRISVAEDDANEDLDLVAYTSYDPAVEVIAATDASLTIDGVTISRTSNILTDVIDGVTLTLNSTTSSPETIAASYDTSTAMTAALGFVNELNSLITLLKSKSARGTETRTAGDLAGDPLVRSLINQITDLTNEAIIGFGSEPVYLANYGIMTNRDGSINLNTATFTKQYEANPDAFNAILNSRVTTDSSLVSGNIAGDDYVPGNYDFILSGNDATIDGDAMSLSDGEYSVNSGNASGLTVKLNGTGSNTTVRIGRSLLEKLESFASANLAFGNDIDERISSYNEDISDYNKALGDFEKQMENLREQYVTQFAAMDSAVASLNRTKDALDMMMDGWRASMNR